MVKKINGLFWFILGVQQNIPFPFPGMNYFIISVGKIIYLQKKGGGRVANSALQFFKHRFQILIGSTWMPLGEVV
jgi:hypothetical protein